MKTQQNGLRSYKNTSPVKLKFKDEKSPSGFSAAGSNGYNMTKSQTVYQAKSKIRGKQRKSP